MLSKHSNMHKHVSKHSMNLLYSDMSKTAAHVSFVKTNSFINVLTYIHIVYDVFVHMRYRKTIEATLTV